jgi:hypothetical protein
MDLYWEPAGQPPDDQGLVLRCRGVRVGTISKLGIDSAAWRNLAGILDMDTQRLTASRESFEESEQLREILRASADRVRRYMATEEGGRRSRLDRMAEEYTRRAIEALRRMGIDLALLGGRMGHLSSTRAESAPAGNRVAAPTDVQMGRGSKPHGGGGVGDASGFRIIPCDFSVDPELQPFISDMTHRRGAEICVNLTNRSCPSNNQARSLWIWTVTLIEIIRWGGLSTSEQLTKEQLLSAFQVWLQCYDNRLVNVTSVS